MSETNGSRENFKSSMYYALLDIVGEDAAQRAEASDGYEQLVDEFQARKTANDDADELAAFLYVKVRDLLAKEDNPSS
jgi:hypothetical protein